MSKKFGVIGSGSWATALTKILTDNGQSINWWVRSAEAINFIKEKKHNQHYLSGVHFNTAQLSLSNDVKEVVQNSDILLIAVPSAYLEDVLSPLISTDLRDKKIISAVKGILPGKDILLNDFLFEKYKFPLQDYFAVLGPCHAEEVAASKLSYLTFSGLDAATTVEIAANFKTDYINIVVNHDIIGVQYAAVLKNIYALGAGIAHGLGYGDNFLSVYIANCADEMAAFLRKAGIKHIVVGEHDDDDPDKHRQSPNYAASVYLGDLLVTCYSSFSRNRSFGTMIGKGYSVKTAQLELNMVAEGYNAARCIYNINKHVKAIIPIAETVYKILWEQQSPAKGFTRVEEVMV
ncbi:MAG: NAD(P)-binding domain-containing protein [Chitinophagaceae bacterium]